MSSKVKEIKAKINKWDPIKLKSFCTAKETINKMKKQPTRWRKLLASDMTNMRLISNIYKQCLQISIRGKKKEEFK